MTDKLTSVITVIITLAVLLGIGSLIFGLFTPKKSTADNKQEQVLLSAADKACHAIATDTTNGTGVLVVDSANYNAYHQTNAAAYDKDGSPIDLFQWNGQRSDKTTVRFSCWHSGAAPNIIIHSLRMADESLYGNINFTTYDAAGNQLD